MRDPADAPKQRLFTFRSAGWTLVLSAGIVGILLWQVTAHLIRVRDARIGDGVHVASYRFDLSNLSVPRDALQPAGSRDFVRALESPGSLTVKELELNPEKWLRKLLVGSDRVIGVTLDGESRAYPLRVLNWHEIVDDHLGATPIAVTYHPLCDSAAVFDRRVMGEVLDLRASGLLYQSNQLLYDHRDEVGTESLWCQLSARAIAGPAAKKGEKLVPLPFSLVTWSVWKEKHPDTTIVEPDPDFSKHYGRRAYANYFGTRELRYRVDGYPPPGDADPWGRVALVADGDGRSLVAVEDLPQDVLPSMYFYAFRWAWAATR